MPRNLLLADDSITIQKVVGITFAGEDFSIVAVDNGDDAVRKAREVRPDVILADVVMPKKNGYEVCDAVKSDPELAHIPVLLLAGTFEAFDESRAHAVGADGHIAKPFESQALINKVRELLDRGTQSRVAPATAPVIARSEAVPSAGARPPLTNPTPASPVGAAAAPSSAPDPTRAGASAGNPPWTIPVTPQVATTGAPARTTSAPPPLSIPSTSVSGVSGASGLAGPPAGSSARGSVRPPPVLARAAPPVGVPAPPSTAARPPDTRTPPPPLGTSTPAAEESFEFLWGHDDVSPVQRGPEPSTSRTEGPTSPRSAVADDHPAHPAGDLDWAALGFETDAAARPAAVRTVAPEQSNPTTAPARAAAPSGAARPATASPAWPAPPPRSEARAAIPSKPAASEGHAASAPFTPASPGFGSPPSFRAAGSPAFIPDPSTALVAFGEPIDLADLEVEEPIPEAPPHVEAHPAPAQAEPVAAAVPPSRADGGEAQLREALSNASREVIERIAWEIIPPLAETIIREHVERLVRGRDK